MDSQRPYTIPSQSLVGERRETSPQKRRQREEAAEKVAQRERERESRFEQRQAEKQNAAKEKAQAKSERKEQKKQPREMDWKERMRRDGGVPLGEEISAFGDVLGSSIRGAAGGLGGLGSLQKMVDSGLLAMSDHFLKTADRIAGNEPLGIRGRVEQSGRSYGDFVDQYSKIAPSPLGPRTPSTEQIEEKVDDVTRGHLVPKTRAGRLAGRVGEFVGDPLTYLGAGGAQLLRRAGVAGAGGLASGISEEGGEGPGQQLLAGLLAMGGAESAAQLPRLFKGASKGVPTAAANLFRRTIDPESAEAAAAALEVGTPLPLRSVTKGNVARPLEVSASRLAPGDFEALGREHQKTLAGQLENVVEATAPGLESSPAAIAEHVGEELKGGLMRSEERVDKAYQAARAPQRATMQAKNAQKVLPELIEKLYETMAPTSEESSTRKYLSEVLSQLEPLNHGGNIPINRAISTLRSLKKFRKYELGKGGPKELVAGAINAFEQDLKNAYHSGRYPEYPQLKAANEIFSEHAKTYRNPFIQKLLNSEFVGDLHKEVWNPENYERLLKALSGERGQQTFKQLKQQAVSELLKATIEGLREGRLTFKQASDMLGTAGSKKMLRDVMGPEGFKIFQNARKYAAGIAKADPVLRANISTGHGGAIQVLSMYNFVRGLVSGNPALMAAGLAPSVVGKMASKLLTNRTFLTKMNQFAADAAKVGPKGQGAQKAVKSFNDLLKIMLPVYNEVSKSEREEPQPEL